MKSKEQKLIDICFSLCISQLIDMKKYPEIWKNKSIPEVAEWITDQLKQCGFETFPIGSSWGVLIEDKDLLKKLKGGI